VLVVVLCLLLVVWPWAVMVTGRKWGADVRHLTTALVLLGGELILLGYLLTPGLAWGDRGGNSAIATASTLVWLGGVVLLVVAGARALRGRRSAPRRERPKSRAHR
jgi:membrane protein implicated in regulation of membrane protease activity